MRRCGTCGADDRADRRVIETLPPTDRFVDPYLCDDSFHEPPDLYDPGEPRPETEEEKWRRQYENTSDHCQMPLTHPRPCQVCGPIFKPRDPTRYAEWRKNGAGWGRR